MILRQGKWYPTREPPCPVCAREAGQCYWGKWFRERTRNGEFGWIQIVRHGVVYHAETG